MQAAAEAHRRRCEQLHAPTHEESVKVIMNCPTCGSPVIVHSGDEGTSHYEAAAYKEIDALRSEKEALEKRLREAVDAGKTLATYTQGFSENRTVAEAKERLASLDTEHSSEVCNCGANSGRRSLQHHQHCPLYGNPVKL